MLFSIATVPFYNLPNNVKKFQFPHIMAHLCSGFGCFYSSYPNRHKIMYHWSFDLHLLLNIFCTYFMASSLEKYKFRPVAHILIRLFAIELLGFLIYLTPPIYSMQMYFPILQAVSTQLFPY